MQTTNDSDFFCFVESGAELPKPESWSSALLLIIPDVNTWQQEPSFCSHPYLYRFSIYNTAPELFSFLSWRSRVHLLSFTIPQAAPLKVLHISPSPEVPLGGSGPFTCGALGLFCLQFNFLLCFSLASSTPRSLPQQLLFLFTNSGWYCKITGIHDLDCSFGFGDFSVSGDCCVCWKNIIPQQSTSSEQQHWFCLAWPSTGRDGTVFLALLSLPLVADSAWQQQDCDSDLCQIFGAGRTVIIWVFSYKENFVFKKKKSKSYIWWLWFGGCRCDYCRLHDCRSCNSQFGRFISLGTIDGVLLQAPWSWVLCWEIVFFFPPTPEGFFDFSSAPFFWAQGLPS